MNGLYIVHSRRWPTATRSDRTTEEILILPNAKERFAEIVFRQRGDHSIDIGWWLEISDDAWGWLNAHPSFFRALGRFGAYLNSDDVADSEVEGLHRCATVETIERWLQGHGFVEEVEENADAHTH